MKKKVKFELILTPDKSAQEKCKHEISERFGAHLLNPSAKVPAGTNHPCWTGTSNHIESQRRQSMGYGQGIGGNQRRVGRGPNHPHKTG